MPVRLFVIALALWCLLAPAAGAATPVTAGPGNHPQVAVDSTGTGHVTWIQVAGNTDTFRYCKLAPTARSCAAAFSFANGDQDVDGGYALLPSQGRVLIVEARGVSPSIAKLLWSSTDNGASFSGPSQIGTLATSGAGISARALYVPAGALGLGAESIFTISELAGTTASFQATGTVPGTTPAEADLTPNVTADIALQGDSLIAVLGDFSTLQWTRYAGPVPATFDSLNAAANWTAPQAIGPLSGANTESSVVSERGGVYVGYEVDAGGGNANFVVRRFTGSGWGAPAVVAAGAAKADLYEDPSGHLHALWTDTSGLRYRYTTNDANTAWSAAQTVVTGETFGFPRLAVNAAGNGWAVWSSGENVRGVPLTRASSTYTGPTRGVTTSGFGATYTLGVPRSCLNPGQRFRVTLKWKRQKRKGNLFVKVRRADFYLGSRVIKVDKQVPFVHTYNVTITQRPGSTIALRARAFIKVRHGKSPKKSIRAKVRVCR